MEVKIMCHFFLRCSWGMIRTFLILVSLVIIQLTEFFVKTMVTSAVVLLAQGKWVMNMAPVMRQKRLKTCLENLMDSF